MLRFEFTEQMVAVLGQCLVKGPYEVVAPVLAELQRQIQAQRVPPKED